MKVIADVHGFFDKLYLLIEKIGPNDICFVGDLVDRGPNSKEVVSFVRSNNYHCVLGNHEKMMIDSFYEECYGEMTYLWASNGGLETLKSYGMTIGNYISLKSENKLPVDFVSDVKWMETLPTYIHFGYVFDSVGNNLVISHSAVLPYWEERDSHNRKEDIIWGRDRIFDSVNVNGLINVFGHTPMRFVEKRNNQICIDLGCFFSGKLASYNFVTSEVVVQE